MRANGEAIQAIRKAVIDAKTRLSFLEAATMNVSLPLVSMARNRGSISAILRVSTSTN